MTGSSLWAIAWWEALAPLGLLAAWIFLGALCSPRARANRAKLRQRRQEARRIRSLGIVASTKLNA
jgi:hypothetical protein